MALYLYRREIQALICAAIILWVAICLLMCLGWLTPDCPVLGMIPDPARCGVR